MAYEPFLIGNMKYGLELGLQPWLLPQDAYAELINGFLKRGVLYKRRGYVPFDRLVHREIDEVIGTHNGATFNGTLAHYPLRPGDLEINDTVETFTDNSDGTLTGDLGGSGTIVYTTGVFSVTFNSAPATDPVANYSWYPDLPCMGLFNYTASNGGQDFFAFTTKRVCKYNTVAKHFEDILGADTFTGDDDQWFWFMNWLNIGFMTNSKDKIHIYNGTTVSQLTITGADPDSCLLIFPYHDRLVLLRTVEGGTTHPQRARWTKIGKYDEGNADDWVDAPTHEWIMGAGFIRNELIVFFERSIWKLLYTGDSRQPFAWRRLATNEGLISPMGLADFADELIGLGGTRMIGTDGTESYNIDDKIPDYVLSMNQNKMAYAYAGVADQDNQTWFSFVSPASDYPDRVLVLNYEEESFSEFLLKMYCFGYFDLQNDPTWDDIDQTWDEIEWTWDERTLQGGYPLLLAGDYAGYIYQMQTGGKDNAAAIEFAAKSGRLNPFVKEGRLARLGWVDFLVDRDPLITLQIQYFINHESAAWLTDSIVLDDGSENEKVWLRSYVNNEAEFHQFRLYNNAINQTPAIHAIVPYFERGGRIN